MALASEAAGRTGADPGFHERPRADRRSPSPSVASTGVRVLARLVDFIIAIGLLLGAALATGTFGEPSGSAWAGNLLLAGGLVLGEATLLRFWRRTPGKAAFGLSVTTLAGEPLPWWRAALRALIVWSPLYPAGATVVSRPEVVLSLALLAAVGVPALLRSDRRGLHDLLAGSEVHPPVSSRRGARRRLGVDLVVLGAAGFVAAYGAYGFSSEAPFWNVDRVPYGLEVQLTFPSSSAPAYVFAPAPDTARTLTCSVTTEGRPVPLGAPTGLPALDERVRALAMEPVYSFPVSSGRLYSVACRAAASAGEYAVAGATVPSRTRGNVLQATSLAAFVAGMALVLSTRRRPVSSG